MGLYIPNAKIPVSCNKCYKIGLAHRLRDLGGHCPRMDLHYSPDEQDFKGDRRVDCPLIEIPPHGDLIDLNQLKIDVINQDYTDNANEDLIKVFRLINTAPTIIEAEEADG